jgi:hypothetical protein
MQTMTSLVRTLTGAGLALPLFLTGAPAETDLGRSEFVSGCTDGALGIEQTREACICAYDFLTGGASEIVREAMFVRVRDGEAAQASYLQSLREGSEDLMTRLATEAEQLIGDCGLVDE